MLAVFLKIFFAILSVGAIGAGLGAALAYASRRLRVKEDHRVKQLEMILPQYNCGACGYSGCASYANAVVNEGEGINKCTPGGADLVEAISQLLGVEASSVERMVAQVHCRGGHNTAKSHYEYDGIRDCNARYQLYSGDKLCKFGCLGDGSCIKVCPVDAISYDEENLVWVDRDKCVGCEKCVEICPTKVLKMIPYDADYIVACTSQEKGKAVRNKCSVGCIACMICVKKFPDAGFMIEKNLSHVDYEQKGDRAPAADACPVKCIIRAFEAEEE